MYFHRIGNSNVGTVHCVLGFVIIRYYGPFSECYKFWFKNLD